MELATGTVIDGRYVLQRLIGEGGMGAVWSATHVVTHKAVALKFLKTTRENQAAMRRFRREARAASAVRHPNVVEVHDVLSHENLPVMVLDLLQGESLAAKLAREGSISLTEFARVMLPVVSAIGTAHAAGIVHRDLKPDNVFLHAEADGNVRPMVLDFGIAKLTNKDGEAAATAALTSTGAVMGTPYYMAPEQVFGEKDIDHQADVWAVGVLAYECLSGKRPIDGDNVGQLFKQIVSGQVVPLAQVAAHLPLDVCQAIDHMLVRDRASRAPDLRELYAALKPYGTVEAQSFGSARFVALPKEAASTTQPSSDGFSHPGTDEIVIPKRRTSPLLLAAGAIGVLVAVAAAFALSARSGEVALPEPEAASAALTAEPSATPAASETDARADEQRAQEERADAAAPPTAASSAPPVLVRRPLATGKRVEPHKPEKPPEVTTAAPEPTRKPGSIVESSPY